jgi:saccharopine dehydrogenase-like NADP-dependent oxidoreductase
MIVMVHEIEYEKDGKSQALKATLIVKGENQLHTAMSKTVGYPLAIAAKLLLTGKIKERGLFIPVHPFIYEPVLKELEGEQIVFKELIDL